MDDAVQGVSEELLLKTEKELGVKLPTEYRALLKIQNGGYLRKNDYPTNYATSWAADHINVTEIYGIGTTSCILSSSYLIEEWDLPLNIVLFAGDGHTWIALDYRKGNENPSVLLLDEDGAGTKTLASSFATFIEGLTTMESFHVSDVDMHDDVEEYDEEKTKRLIAKRVRNGRNNDAIKRDNLEVVANGTAKQVQALLEEMYGLCDRDVEKHLIFSIIDYDSTKVRKSLAEYLLACSMNLNQTLNQQDVKEILCEMQKLEQNKKIQFYIHAAIEHVT